jgi:3-oxoacyl-[acyl-carrier protein] reductase
MRQIGRDYENFPTPHDQFLALDNKFQRAFQDVGDLLIVVAVHRHDRAFAQNNSREHAAISDNKLAVDQWIQVLDGHVLQANMPQFGTCLIRSCAHCVYPSPSCWPNYSSLPAVYIAPIRDADGIDIYTWPMETGLRNRVAIVAASSKGIGRATALAFAAEGANLAICARHAETLEPVAEEARRFYGVDVYTATFDVAEDESVRQFVDNVHRHFGRIDVCVTNAGGPPAKPFAKTTMAEWDRAYQLNLRSIVSFAHAVLPSMQQQRWGRFIAITSIAVKQPVLELVLSNSVRTGVLGLVRSLATQYGPDNITINNVGPGHTATDRIKELAQANAQTTGRSASDYESEVAKEIPLRRLAKPEEVADAIVWLASERAAYITGQTILVDGGIYRGL